MVNFRPAVRAIIFASLLLLLSAASVSQAFGQFTLTVSSLTPLAGVDPGGRATADVSLGASPGFSSPVALSCAVTSGPVTTGPSAPVCTPSPLSPTPPAIPSLTITTTNATPVGTYQIVVSGTSGAVTKTATLYLSVADLTEDYSLSVLPTTALPSPIPAGSSATTVVSVDPIGSYSGHTVTFACLAISPIVIAAPYCSFNPPFVIVGNGAAATTTLTINTFGSASNTGKVSFPRAFYALWLALPGLALVGVRANHRRKLLGILFLLAVAGGLLLLPACNTSTIGTTAVNGQVTPADSYTFSLSASDENGAEPSNVGLCTGTGSNTCDTATVTLVVTKANTAN